MPVAHASACNDQYHYYGRLLRFPCKVIGRDDVAAWLAEHPQGRVVAYLKKPTRSKPAADLRQPTSTAPSSSSMPPPRLALGPGHDRNGGRRTPADSIWPTSPASTASPLAQMPQDLYIPPDALEIMLDAFEGPRPAALPDSQGQRPISSTSPWRRSLQQYLDYIESMRASNLELAADYLVMAAMLIEIKSRMLLAPAQGGRGRRKRRPRAELVRRLMEYEQMKLARPEIEPQCPRPIRSSSGSRPWWRNPCWSAIRVSIDDLKRKPGWPSSARPAEKRITTRSSAGTLGPRAHGHHPARPRAGGRFRPF